MEKDAFQSLVLRVEKENLMDFWHLTILQYSLVQYSIDYFPLPISVGLFLGATAKIQHFINYLFKNTQKMIFQILDQLKLVLQTATPETGWFKPYILL